jgi:hypothetical protein
MMKTEGTSQTFGQLVVLGDQIINTGEGSFNPSVSSTGIVPQDTIVTIVEDATSSTPQGSLNSSIALAAASSNQSATAVVPAGSASMANSLSANMATNMPNVVGYAVIVGSSVKLKEEIDKALLEARRFDLLTTYRSKKSEPIHFNSLKSPNLQAKLIYNFYTEDEEDIRAQEDQSVDPLLNSRPSDVPRYVELSWNAVDVTEPLAGTVEFAKVNQSLRKETFSNRRGQTSAVASNFAFSSAKQKKKFNPIVQDGVNKKIVDIHEPELAFSSIANSNAFANVVGVTVDVQSNAPASSNIPFSNMVKA